MVRNIKNIEKKLTYTFGVNNMIIYMEELDSRIQKWIRDNKSTDTFTIDVKLDASSINLNLGNYKFKVVPPNEKNKYFIVSSTDGRRLRWIDDMNLYCIQKRPKIGRILSKLISNIEKYSQSDQKPAIILDKDITQDTYNINFHKEKVRLQKASTSVTSKSVFNIDPSVKRLFNSNVVSDRIVTEYLNIWKSFNSTRNKIDIVNDNIYHWRVLYSGFNKDLTTSLETINQKFGYDTIEVNIMFHDIYYPNYPPMIKVMRPRLQNSLMHRISAMKQLQLDYWDPTNSMIDIIKRVFTILDKFGKVDIDTDLNDPITNPSGAYLSIEPKLIKLASMMETSKVDEIDADLKLVKITDVLKSLSKEQIIKDQKINTSVRPIKNNTVWGDGTGFGTSGASEWDINEYIKLQAERDKQICNILEDIIIDLESNNDRAQIYDAIKSSLLITFINDQLRTSSLVELGRYQKTSMLYFTILQNLALDDAIHILAQEDDDTMNILKKLRLTSDMAIKLDANNTIAQAVITIYDMIEPIYNAYIAEREAKRIDHENKIIEEAKVETDMKNTYIKNLESMKFDEANIVGDSSYYYLKYVEKLNNVNRCLKRLSDEIPSLITDIPIHFDASIFIRVDENKPMCMRALITGPPNTPYESGCFIFDILMDHNYPLHPPHVNMVNTGNVRFNPNLYSSGKVCLSILNTYVGPDASSSEKWNGATGTLYQVLVSIQSQILIDEPYYNEPGHEVKHCNDIKPSEKIGLSKRTDSQLAPSSREYNNRVRIYTMKYAMLHLLTDINAYPQFRDVIKTHFLHKRERIIATCNEWVEYAKEYYELNKGKKAKYYYEDTYKNNQEAILNDYIATRDKLIIELNKLQ